MPEVTAIVDFEDGYAIDPPEIQAVVDPSGETAEFARDFEAAIAWATARSARVTVRLYDQEWSAGTEPYDDLPHMTPEDRAAAAVLVGRQFDRYAAESATYDNDQRWYHAILDPNTDLPLDDAEKLVRDLPGVVDLERRETREDEALWIIGTHAPSRDVAERINERITHALWPAERIGREFPDGTFYISTGQSSTGLMHYLEDCHLVRYAHRRR
ncbi:hypothetical protein [Patulibacter sp.]|uniref:hypothetical protein n=1 Tax=Patulibacter sp. TaxID=1912859 RepID=UPI002726BC8E|nr:hypothetical protein [Patulibacter sp.]MDO9408590.1 hypothetical protein [Patulibacter sp.]